MAGWFRKAADWLTMASVPMAGAPTATFDSAPRPVDLMIGEMLGRGAAPRVGRLEALSVPAVQQGRRLICSIATLPLVQRGPDNTVARNPLLEQFDEDVANVVHLTQTVEDLVFEGVAWWRITGFGSDGFPTRVRRLDPGTVSMQPPTGANAPLPAGYDPRGSVVWVDGKQVPTDELIRFDSPNPAVLVVGGRAIKRAILLDETARLYADDPRPLDYFTPGPNAEEVDDAEIGELLGKWRAARKKRSTAYMPKALEYKTVDTPSPNDLQLVQLQKQAALDIANAFGVDPEDLGISTTSRTYANAVDRRRDRINDVLSPYMRAITDRLSMGDVTRRGYTVVFDLDDYMRANPTERWSVYEKALNLGVLSREEVRAEEGLPAGAPTAPEPAPTPAPTPVGASNPASMHFDAPAALHFVNMPVEQFSVDRERRIIEGLALPYGKVAHKYRFEQGALQWTDTARVKLLRDHDFRQALGRAEALTDAADGFRVRFKVARGAEGDRALELAEDGVLDGLSVGVDFDLTTDTRPDPNDRRVTLVRRADLREVSLTAMPAFDDARLTRVAANITTGVAGMPDTPEAQPQNAPPAAGGITLTAEQFATLVGRPAPVTLAPAAEAEPEQRQVVNPTRLTASVTEAAPYRFDRRGDLSAGTHEFSTDVFAAIKGDHAAQERLDDFVRAQFDVITTDVNELNPSRQRPDLYVDQRTFRYPLWEAVNKGTLSDITPFVFPKFSSAADLVAAHTEGTEPTSGTFVTTSATVTPTALSGKAKISRETWDQGGNPQISNLIWRQMVKGWFEALEAAVVTLLNDASPTGIDFSGTPGLANDDLDQAITSAFAALQFVRGGFSMDFMATQVDLYKALVAAVDADGRRLYPALGPTNATGTVRSRFATLDINGVVAIPSWALAATGSVAASSYLFDRDSVHMWASAPQRLTIDRTEVANVYIGLFGYKAGVISDINGVREVIYDPA
jgi:HK97 family phage prohead protease